MAEQTYTVGVEPKIILARVGGDLSVRGWEQRTISFVSDGHVSELQQEGNTLVIIDCDDDIELHVPMDTDIQATNVNGDVSIEDVRRVELKDIGGDVSLEQIGADVDLENIGTVIELTNLGADLEVKNAPVLRSRDGIGADASISDVAQVEIESVGADLSLEHVETALIGDVGGDLDAREVATALSCGNVGGDCQVQGNANTVVTIGNVGADIEVNSAASVQMGNVGADCDLRDVQGKVEIGNIGADASIIGVGGKLEVGHIGADADLKGLHGNIEIGHIGADLELDAAFPPDSHVRLNVGGDASIALPNNPNLSVSATVGGEVSGQSVGFSGHGNLINLVYGSGAAHLELSVGGDLDLSGSGRPRSSSSSESWGEFGREMGELGREMGKLGEELGRELANAFKDVTWSHAFNFADEVGRKVQEKARRAQRHAEERARHAQERARHAEERARHTHERGPQRPPRMHVRVNSREWQLDPDRLERIKDEARRAASEGLSGALEAVERAVSNLHMPTPPAPPMPPNAPGAPTSPSFPFGANPPAPPMPPTSPFAAQPHASATGSVRNDPPAPPQSENPAPGNAASASTPDLEQEREAILRMIAEGRISPEEGDLLLEGLGS